ncbi:MAG: tetratricopeptide repeat protein [Bacteroidetes bacterium]|jgi:tetratricopeptide (TPR) repeat protein|nr:tetratricopeptide repeat protein [Bacteroidota bacterium]
MATYKKRGGKPRTKEEQQSELEKNSTTAEVFRSLDEGASRTEAWIQKNQKVLLGAFGVIALAVVGYFVFQEFVQNPKEAEAMSEMSQAQNYWEEALNITEKDSLYNLALHGGGGKYGFLDIIDNYGGTDAANLSHYYVGIAYLNMNKYKEAIEHLDKFKSKDEILAPIAKGSIGDAFTNLGQHEDALKYYEDAASMRTNDFTTPRFLFKAGLTALNLNKIDKAKKHFEKIVKDYPNSEEFAKAEVYLGRTEAMTK